MLAKFPPIKVEQIPDFIHAFLSSKYIAGFLGFFVPNLYDIREFLLENLDRVEPSFVRRAFSNVDESDSKSGMEEKVYLEDIKPFLHYLVKHFKEMQDYFRSKDEEFHIELQFQLPFIHKSSLKRDEKTRLFSDSKVCYFNTFRQNLRGAFVVADDKVEPFDIFDKNVLVESFSILDNTDKFKLYLVYPAPLQSYWELVLNLIAKRF